MFKYVNQNQVIFYRNICPRTIRILDQYVHIKNKFQGLASLNKNKFQGVLRSVKHIEKGHPYLMRVSDDVV